MRFFLCVVVLFSILGCEKEEEPGGIFGEWRFLEYSYVSHADHYTGGYTITRTQSLGGNATLRFDQTNAVIARNALKTERISAFVYDGQIMWADRDTVLLNVFSDISVLELEGDNIIHLGNYAEFVYMFSYTLDGNTLRMEGVKEVTNSFSEGEAEIKFVLRR